MPDEKDFYNMQKDNFSLLKGMTPEENMCNMWLLQPKMETYLIFCLIKVLKVEYDMYARNLWTKCEDTIDELI